MSIVDRIKRRFNYSLHNLIGHPLAEILWIITGDKRVFTWVHDVTLPKSDGWNYGQQLDRAGQAGRMLRKEMSNGER